MSKDIFIIDDRPDWALSDEERKSKLEEAKKLLGEDGLKRISREVAEWKNQNKR